MIKVANMANTELLEKPWLDILPPPAPVSHELLIGLTVIVLSLLIMAAILYRRYKQPRQQALQQLKQIQKRVKLHAADNKQVLYKINRILSKGLQIHNLSRFTPANVYASDWQAFYQRLKTLQYSNTPPNNAHTYQLLRDAQHWLRTIKQ